MSLRLLPYGADAVLVEPDDPSRILGLRDSIGAARGVIEAVPGARTLLVVFDPSLISVERVHQVVQAADTSEDVPVPGAAACEVVLDVHYDGADLGSTAEALGLDVDDLVRRHVEGTYVVAFCGFAPGFAYLTGLDQALHVARLAQPRTLVPAGSVGIGAEFTGVYPRPSPGGWRLLGHTDALLWDVARTPPALLSPGTPVRFRRT